MVGTIDNSRALIHATSELKPDEIVLDIAMPLLNGLDAGERAKRRLPHVKLVFLTMTADSVVAEAFRRGASAYLVKTCASTEMIAAVRDVLRGKTYLSTQLSKDTVDFMRRQNGVLVEEEERLIERQREVLQLLAEGKVMKEVGNILHMATRTVAFHKYRIMEVLGAKSNADLVKYAVRHHLTVQ